MYFTGSVLQITTFEIYIELLFGYRESHERSVTVYWHPTNDEANDDVDHRFHRIDLRL